MAKKITFLIASNTGASVKNATVSVIVLASVCIIFFIILFALGVVMVEYYRLKTGFAGAGDLQREIARQDNEIQAQRKQIQRYANEINGLKSKIIQFNNFENKIRIIADIKEPGEQGGVIGIGGPAPEDLDVNLSLAKSHRNLIREMHEQVNQLSQVSMRQIGGFESVLKHLNDQKSLLASTPAISPAIGWITSRFGFRKSPFTGRKEFHKGLDISSRMKTPVMSTADGVVVFCDSKGFLGKMIIIDHGHGMVSRYAHLHTFLKKKGDRVKRGDIIGQIGNSGRSTGPHLHYDVRLNGISVNPEKYILN